MKCSKADTRCASHSLPELRFENQDLTSFSGLVLYQALFQKLDLRARIRSCTRGLHQRTSYRASALLLLLITHLLLGWRRLRDLDYYRRDPLLGKTVGLKRVPSVSTMSRFLTGVDRETADRYRLLSRELVMERVVESCPTRVTLDFDGSVITTRGRTIEGTAIGFNPKAKGCRSYYPLFGTVAQTRQVMDFLHRPGNVHDSVGAKEFILGCFYALSDHGFRGEREARIDSAFFSEDLLFSMAMENIFFTVSVPFERFVELKFLIESRERWKTINDTWSYFEPKWKPKSWGAHLRILIYRQRKKVPTKGPIQLDLFTPIEREYEYKVVATNRFHTAKAILEFHNGRGSQEGILAEGKSQASMGYIPTRRKIGNEVYLTSSIMAHNLNREMQMLHSPPTRRNTAKRACLWAFEQMDTIRKTLIQRAGRLTRPKGRLTLTVSATGKTRSKLLAILSSLQKAA